MVSRCMILCLMLATLDIPFILEQPASSLMQYHPHFQYLCKRFDIYRVFVWLGSYGGTSPKATLLYSNYKFCGELYLPLPDADWPAEMATRYIDGQGLPRVCGGKDLKNSQHYPRLFGAAVAQLYDKHRNEVQARIKARRHLAKTIHLACTPQTCNKNSSVSLMVADGDGVNKHIYIYICTLLFKAAA
ncbi:unnamed protein product [Durusdinium trenchii]|uniref:Uncharacterized protein n=1 Tax=Durusdinium trenchii TaxID=1381693 RepID=A0ABP0QPP0_9DINO